MPTVPPKRVLVLDRRVRPRPKLNRFTSLPVALDMLSKRKITLLSPESWEDNNDAFYLERYREEMRFRSVLAICFSMCSETFHHWRIFSHGSSGVCLEFDKAKLLDSLTGLTGFKSGPVNYRYIHSLRSNRPDIEDWPFLKRKPFEAESEFRIIYETKKDAIRSIDVDIDLSSIRKITLSPWIPESVADSVTTIIKSIEGCSHLEVDKSSLIDNALWREIIE